MTRRSRRAALGAGLLALAALAANPVAAQSFGAPPVPPAAPASATSTELAPKVTLDVTRLRRLADKGVLQMEITVTNRSDLGVTLRDLGLGSWTSLGGIQLVDFANKRRYSIGSADDCLCTIFANANGGVVAPGEARTFWAWFALPPAEVQQMSVLVRDRSPILNVPLQ